MAILEQKAKDLSNAELLTLVVLYPMNPYQDPRFDDREISEACLELKVRLLACGFIKAKDIEAEPPSINPAFVLPPDND